MAGVSYHLLTVNKETGAFENLFSVTGKRVGNEIMKLGNFMILFPDAAQSFFEKDWTYYDFIDTMRHQEVSENIFEPEVVKSKLLATLDLLKTKDGFPMPHFNYFRLDDVMDIDAISVTLLGEELNKITVGGTYNPSESYNIQTYFDATNNYQRRGLEIYRDPPRVNAVDQEKNRQNSKLNLDVFPSKISILDCSQNARLGKEIKEVSLLLKTPLAYFEPEINNLVEICDLCIAHNLGLKTYVEY